MARRRRVEVAPADSAPPSWFWQFRGRDWGVPWPPSVGEPVDVAAVVAARRQWGDAARAWLEERGLVTWQHSPMTWHAYQRICREEPHHVVRRPEHAQD